MPLLTEDRRIGRESAWEYTITLKDRFLCSCGTIVRTLTVGQGPRKMKSNQSPFTRYVRAKLKVCVVVFSVAVTAVAAQSDVETQLNFYNDRQNENGHVIDSIFNIPITAIKQTATVAQGFSPENSDTIDNIFKIPISTLEAVGDLVKITSSQRRPNAEEIQKIRQEKRKRILAEKEQQRTRREQLQYQKLQHQKLQQQIRRNTRHYHRDPFGFNSFTNLLFGHHGIIGKPNKINIEFGNHQTLNVHNEVHDVGQREHRTFGFLFGLGNHGNQNGQGGNGIYDIHGSVPNGGSSSYEVHEEVDEGPRPIGNFFGPFFSNNSHRAQNKIAPNNNSNRSTVSKYDYQKLTNKLLHDEPPLENKVAPKSYKTSYY